MLDLDDALAMPRDRLASHRLPRRADASRATHGDCGKRPKTVRSFSGIGQAPPLPHHRDTNRLLLTSDHPTIPATSAVATHAAIETAGVAACFSAIPTNAHTSTSR